MSELIQQFDFQNNELRLIGDYDKPMFVVKDICKILSLSNVTEATRNIPDKWKSSEIVNTKI